MRENILFPGLVAASLVAAMLLAPVLASAVTAITAATISSTATSLDSSITTASKIAKNGKDGAFGYGVVTLTDLGGSGDSLMVTTTHQGVLDSELQGDDAGSAVWHNHYITVSTSAPAECAVNTNFFGLRVEVSSITFESPGKVKVNQNVVELLNMPRTFSGTNALNGTPLTLTPETTATAVISFTLHPLFNGPGGTLSNVCVEDITPFSLT